MAAATQQLSVSTYGGGSVLTTSAQTGASSFTPGDAWEFECCFQIRGVDVVNGDTIQMRVVDSFNTPAPTITNTVTLTVNKVQTTTAFFALMM